MSIAKHIEVTSESTTSFDDAAANAIREAGKSINGIRQAWVQDMEIVVQDDGSFLYRTTCKITFVVGADG